MIFHIYWTHSTTDKWSLKFWSCKFFAPGSKEKIEGERKKDNKNISFAAADDNFTVCQVFLVYKNSISPWILVN